MVKLLVIQRWKDSLSVELGKWFMEADGPAFKCSLGMFFLSFFFSTLLNLLFDHFKQKEGEKNATNHIWFILNISSAFLIENVKYFLLLFIFASSPPNPPKSLEEKKEEKMK